jgi:hypothetical protein
LKFNESLERLILVGNDDELGDASVRCLETVLGQHNHTVQRAELRLWPGLDRGRGVRCLLERNRRIRAAVEELAKLHVPPAADGDRVQLRRSVLPAVLERIGPFPTLVYRLVRWVNVNDRRAMNACH